jgi:hypothetical protein
MNQPRRVTIHIDHLVVEASRARVADAPRIQAALETELIRLFGNGEGHVSGGAQRAVNTYSPGISTEPTPARIGAAIARELHRVVTSGR